MEKGCLFRGHRIVVPLALREKMLKELHESHLGIIKSKSNARARMWWPNIDRDIETWIGTCQTCASVRPAPPRDPPAPWPAPAQPWQRLHIDYMTVNQRVYLVIIDAFSKWLECLHMHNGTTTIALITKLKGVFAIFGIPEVLVSDNDVKINSIEFKAFCASNGIKYMTSPIYHPPSNGQAENSVRTCKKMLKCIMKENSQPHQMHEQLLGYLFNYRNTVHCATGETPAKLMFGRQLRTRLDLILPSKENLQNQPTTLGRRYFEIDDMVWVRWYNARKEVWQIGKVKEKIGNKMYKIYIIDSEVCCIRHVDQIIKYTGSKDSIMAKNVGNTRHQLHSPPMRSYVQPIVSSAEPSTPSAAMSQVSQSGEVDVAAEEVTDEAPPGHHSDSVAKDRLDCESEESERGTVENVSTAAPATAIDTPCPQQCAAPALSPSAPPLTPSRSTRYKNKVDYKKYF